MLHTENCSAVYCDTKDVKSSHFCHTIIKYNFSHFYYYGLNVLKKVEIIKRIQDGSITRIFDKMFICVCEQKYFLPYAHYWQAGFAVISFWIYLYKIKTDNLKFLFVYACLQGLQQIIFSYVLHWHQHSMLTHS